MAALRCFEDIPLGLELPRLVKGPLTTVHVIRWTGAAENLHRIHYDHPYAIEREKLPGLLIAGTFKQQFVMQLLADWARPEGWPWKVRFQFRAMNLVGETLTLWGRVKDKRNAPSYGLVDIEIGIVNDDGRESAPGEAVVVFAYRDGPAVPYPFVPPPS